MGAKWALAVVGLCGIAVADMGSIPFVPDVEIFEPDQNALICWDGTTEILVLSTNLRAGKTTKVLEVIPLPSKPEVKEADPKLFIKVTNLLNAKIPPERRGSGGKGGLFGERGADDEEPLVPAAKIVLHKRIGVTDISVAKVLKPDAFVEWVHAYLKKQDVQTPTIPEPLQKVVEEYLADGFTWFSFNVVSLDKEVHTKSPIQYRFRSGQLYYPLRITRAEKGKTNVKLLILTPRVLRPREFAGISFNNIEKPHRPVPVYPHELRKLHAASYRLLGTRTVRLRTWEIRGKLSSFRNDLLAGKPKTFYLKRKDAGTVYGPFAMMGRAKVQIGRTAFRLLCDQYPPKDPAKDTFRLRTVINWRLFGPFPFKDGAVLTIGDAEFTLLLRRPADGNGDDRD